MSQSRKYEESGPSEGLWERFARMQWQLRSTVMKSCSIHQAKRGQSLLARSIVSARKWDRFPLLLRSTNDPTISHLHQTTLAFANPETEVGGGFEVSYYEILMKIDCSTFYLTSYPDLLSASSTRDLGTRLPFTAITKPFFCSFCGRREEKEGSLSLRFPSKCVKTK